MWLPEGKMTRSGNIYVQRTTKSLLVTALVHNDEMGDNKVVLKVADLEGIEVPAGDSIAFTCVMEKGQAIITNGGRATRST